MRLVCTISEHFGVGGGCEKFFSLPQISLSGVFPLCENPSADCLTLKLIIIDCVFSAHKYLMARGSIDFLPKWVAAVVVVVTKLGG